MSLIMINLGNSDKNYSGLIRMLDTLLNKMRGEQGKISQSILKNDFDIDLSPRQEEVNEMCNLSDGILEDGIIKGRAEGRAEGRTEGITIGEAKGKVALIVELLKENFPLEKALKLANIDRETYEKYKNEV